jgi:hypothetical protein
MLLIIVCDNRIVLFPDYVVVHHVLMSDLTNPHPHPSSFTAGRANRFQQGNGSTWFTLWFFTSTYFPGCSFKNVLILHALYMIKLDEHWPGDVHAFDDTWLTFNTAPSNSSDDKSCSSIINLIKKVNKFQTSILKLKEFYFSRLLIQISTAVRAQYEKQ